MCRQLQTLSPGIMKYIWSHLAPLTVALTNSIFGFLSKLDPPPKKKKTNIRHWAPTDASYVRNKFWSNPLCKVSAWCLNVFLLKTVLNFAIKHYTLICKWTVHWPLILHRVFQWENCDQWFVKKCSWWCCQGVCSSFCMSKVGRSVCRCQSCNMSDGAAGCCLFLSDGIYH